MFASVSASPPLCTEIKLVRPMRGCDCGVGVEEGSGRCCCCCCCAPRGACALLDDDDDDVVAGVNDATEALRPEATNSASTATPPPWWLLPEEEDITPTDMDVPLLLLSSRFKVDEVEEDAAAEEGSSAGLVDSKNENNTGTLMSLLGVRSG